VEARNCAYPLATSHSAADVSLPNFDRQFGDIELDRLLTADRRRTVFLVGRERPPSSHGLCQDDVEQDLPMLVYSPEDEDVGTDPVVDALREVLQFARTKNDDPSSLFFTTIHEAIRAHLAHTYGEPGAEASHRGLTSWQERRAKRFLAMNAGDHVSIAGAAKACRLSRSYFIRAFKITTGETPHRWLCKCRVEMAKELLLGPMPIAEIALECGFSDQSHLTRVFAKTTGVPPGVWRRDYRVHAAGGRDIAAAITASSR
jgi:AraC-like DNA-binding protein